MPHRLSLISITTVSPSYSLIDDSREPSRATLNCQTLGNVRLCLKAKLAVDSLILRESARVHIPACGVVEVAGFAGLFRYLTGIFSDARRILYSGAIDIEDAVPATTPHGTDSILFVLSVLLTPVQPASTNEGFLQDCSR